MNVTTVGASGAEAPEASLTRTLSPVRSPGWDASRTYSHFARRVTGATTKRWSVGAWLHTLRTISKTIIPDGAGANYCTKKEQIMLNHITLQGRLTRDPELRLTQNGLSIATLRIAVDRDYDREKTDYIDIVAWRQTADLVEKYFRKGQMILLSGSLQMREWKDRDGSKRVSAEVVADHVYFCESKRGRDNGSEENDGRSNNYRDSARGPVDAGPGWEDYSEDDDGELPF